MGSRQSLRFVIATAGAVLLAPAAGAEEVDQAAAAAALAAAYPDQIAQAREDAVVWRDGTVMAIGTIRPANLFHTIIKAPSLGEQFLYTSRLNSAR